MDDIEILAFIASLLVVVGVWFRWYHAMFTVNRFKPSTGQRAALGLAPICCLVLQAVVLRTGGATEIRNDPSYLAFYIFVAAGWLGAMTLLFPLLGVSVRDDVLERKNGAACWASIGALIGAFCSFAGANIGDGPGVEAVFFSALLSSSLFFASWFVLEITTHISEAITVDRDSGSGFRLAGFLVAVGIVGGYSVSGDWVSALATAKDFLQSCWPAVILSILAISVERLGRAQWEKSRSNNGLAAAVALLYVTLALVWTIWRGLHS